MNVLLTGGLGYIGSHITVTLLSSGYQVIIIDNLSNSKVGVLNAIYRITGTMPIFRKGDVRDQVLVETILYEFKIDAVIHLAGLKAVGESTQEPLKYYDHNVSGTISLLKAMQKFQVTKLVFSSSATVYGIPSYLPLDEAHPTNPQNPYGRSKLMIEEILRDVASANNAMNILALRYFNPVGAHESGLIGEDPNGIPNNLMPYISQVAIGQLEMLSVFGNDYQTPDGTGIRDYIHVMDLAEGHLAALEFLIKSFLGFKAINLGTGVGYSVLEMVEMYQKVSGRKIPYQIKGRRPGDIDMCYAQCDEALKLLVWKAKCNLEKMCADSWNWQKKNLGVSNTKK
jgi:UDP-glucose 4-epimerase